MENVVTLILGGGRGTRLYPLTKLRSKPAVPIAGKYRLIDIPLSNCINSGLRRIYVITQFNSVSLHHHVHSYSFDAYSHNFVEILAAQQTCSNNGEWYQGTADAVRQNFNYIRQRNIEYVLILSGDQLYRMDFRQMIATHVNSKADVTIAGVPVTRDHAHDLGIMRVDGKGSVVGFLEKPQTDEELDFMKAPPEYFQANGIQAKDRDFIASMGIYLFNRKTLFDALEKTGYTDFGKEVFPAAIRSKHVQLHLFDGYWEDIGTIRSFYEANLAMCKANPEFEISPATSPTYSRSNFLPATRINQAKVHQSMLADGCIIEDGVLIDNSIVGLRSRIAAGTAIYNSILRGYDYIGNLDAETQIVPPGQPAMGIGKNVLIEGAIVDKNCSIGDDVVITNPRHIENTREYFFGMIRDGVICVQKNAVIPHGWKLGEFLDAQGK